MKLWSAICSTQTMSTQGQHNLTATEKANWQSLPNMKETCSMMASCYRRPGEVKTQTQAIQHHLRGDYLAVQCYCSWDSRALLQLSWPPIQTWSRRAACSGCQTPPARNRLLQYTFHCCHLEVLPSSDWPVERAERVLTVRRQLHLMQLGSHLQSCIHYKAF